MPFCMEKYLRRCCWRGKYRAELLPAFARKIEEKEKEFSLTETVFLMIY